jgi:hypothetical protein
LTANKIVDLLPHAGAIESADFSPDGNRIERFRFRWNHESALSSCFVAYPDGEPVSTSPGNALITACSDGTASVVQLFHDTQELMTMRPLPYRDDVLSAKEAVFPRFRRGSGLSATNAPDFGYWP